MTKSLMVDPKVVRAPGSIQSPVLPINQYNKTLKDERDNYSNEDLFAIWHDMVVIREFETMLNLIKSQGSFRGIPYNYLGPIHLSIGQEAATVGMAFYLTNDDFIFGSHRSHGDILAKGLSAIRKLDDQTLYDMMNKYLDGAILRIIEPGFSGSVKDLARNYLFYGSLAEIFGRETGFNKGLGGSMHVFFTPFGIYPNNALVGASAGIGAGAALFKKLNQQKGIVVANIGDAALGCGPVWEAMNFSSMQQYNTLWEESFRGGLPIIFNFINNFYGMGGQTQGETMGFDFAVRSAMGINPEAMHAERIDGYNPLALIDAFKRKKQLIVEERKGPAFLDTVTYRISGHSSADAGSYRVREEIDMWQAIDPIPEYERNLISENIATQAEFDDHRAKIVDTLASLYKLAIDLKISPRVTENKIANIMFSNQKIDKLDSRSCDVLIPKEENPQLKNIARKVRTQITDIQAAAKAKSFQLRDGIFEAMLHRFYLDPTFVAYGEEHRDWGGAFACYRGLTEALPYHRFFNSPISEAAIVGSAVGYAISGGRVCVELMYCDFMGRAGDEIFNQMAKWQGMSGGILKMPLVLRVNIGSTYGAQHSQDWSALIGNIPGLKAVYPVTPYDAKGLLNSALSGSDPIIFFENQRIYGMYEMFEKEVPENYYEVPIGIPAKRTNGSDITIITIGAALYRAIEAVDVLKKQYNMNAELFDARSINPLDYEPFIESIKKTGRAVIISDACERGSFLNTIAANLQRYAFDYLDGPVLIVGAPNLITPCAEMEEDFFPNAQRILDAINENIVPLTNHQPKYNYTNLDSIRRNRAAV